MTVLVHWGDATVLPRAQTVAGYLHFSRRVQPFPDSKFSGEMLPTKAYYGRMASIPCQTFFRITFGRSFDQDTEQALEELQQKFAVLRKTREASAMASATWNGLFPLITLFGFLRNSFAKEEKLLGAHHPGHEQQDASSNFSAWTTNLGGKEQVRRAKTEAWSKWFWIETSWQVFVVRPPRSTMGTNDRFKDIQQLTCADFFTSLDLGGFPG